MVARAVHLLLAVALAVQCGPVCRCTLDRLLSWAVAGDVAGAGGADDDGCVDPHADAGGDHDDDGPSHPHPACHCGGPLGLAKADRPTSPPSPAVLVAIFHPVVELRPTIVIPSAADRSSRAGPLDRPPDVGDRLPLLA